MAGKRHKCFLTSNNNKIQRIGPRTHLEKGLKSWRSSPLLLDRRGWSLNGGGQLFLLGSHEQDGCSGSCRAGISRGKMAGCAMNERGREMCLPGLEIHSRNRTGAGGLVVAPVVVVPSFPAVTTFISVPLTRSEAVPVNGFVTAQRRSKMVTDRIVAGASSGRPRVNCYSVDHAHHRVPLTLSRLELHGYRRGWRRESLGWRRTEH